MPEPEEVAVIALWELVGDSTCIPASHHDAEQFETVTIIADISPNVTDNESDDDTPFVTVLNRRERRKRKWRAKQKAERGMWKVPQNSVPPAHRNCNAYIRVPCGIAFSRFIC